jgi:hypothetical protein|tara:strand:- start:855 stop:1076 length:222 start_codon:yes stop_codon:yes gene_type:complete
MVSLIFIKVIMAVSNMLKNIIYLQNYGLIDLISTPFMEASLLDRSIPVHPTKVTSVKLKYLQSSKKTDSVKTK